MIKRLNYIMRHILLFFIFIQVMSACTQRKSYTLHQQCKWKIGVTQIRDSVFIKTTTDKTCFVDTFYKGKDGYYANWNKKLFFATVDTFIHATSFGADCIDTIYEIRKVTNPKKDPILRQYPDGLYKTEILSYNQEQCDSSVKLIIAYYYDNFFNIVGIIIPYSVVTFIK